MLIGSWACRNKIRVGISFWVKTCYSRVTGNNFFKALPSRDRYSYKANVSDSTDPAWQLSGKGSLPGYPQPKHVPTARHISHHLLLRMVPLSRVTANLTACNHVGRPVTAFVLSRNQPFLYARYQWHLVKRGLGPSDLTLPYAKATFVWSTRSLRWWVPLQASKKPHPKTHLKAA